MKFLRTALSAALLLILTQTPLFAQIRTGIENGQERIYDQSLFFQPAHYKATLDSLEKKIAVMPADTTSIFLCALICDLSNNIQAKPIPGDKQALSGLSKAKELVIKAKKLGMHDFKLMVLEAQVYRDLTYRYAGDQKWNLKRDEIARRRNEFNAYKLRANDCYSKLAELDRANAHAYLKLVVRTNYPIGG